MLVLLLAVLGLFFSLRYEGAQDIAVRLAERWLTQKLRTSCQLGKIRVNYPHQVSISGLFVRDLEGDTLLYLGHLEIKTDLRQLWNKSIVLEAIHWQDVSLYLKQTQGENNLDFILEAFAPKNPSSELTTWRIDAYNAEIAGENTHITLRNKDSGTFLGIQPRHVDAIVGKIDIQNSDYTLLQSAFEDARFLYFSGKAAERKNRAIFDANNIAVEGLALQTKNIRWNVADSLLVEILQAKGTEQSGLQLLDLQSNIIFTPDAYHVREFAMRMNKAQLDGSFRMLFDTVGNFEQLQLKVSTSSMHWSDLQRFADVKDLYGAKDKRFEMKGNVYLSKKEVNMSELQVGSEVGSSIEVSGKLTNYTEVDQMKSDLKFSDIHLVMDDIGAWVEVPTTVQPNDVLTGELYWKGGIFTADVHWIGQFLRGNQAISAVLKGQYKDLDIPEKRAFQAFVDNARGNGALVAELLPRGTLPNSATLPQQIKVKGQVMGVADSIGFELLVVGLRDSNALKMHLNGNVAGGVTNIQFNDLSFTKAELEAWVPAVSALNWLQFPENSLWIGNIEQNADGWTIDIGLPKVGDSGSLKSRIVKQAQRISFDITTKRLEPNVFVADTFLHSLGFESLNRLNLAISGSLDTAMQDLQVALKSPELWLHSTLKVIDVEANVLANLKTMCLRKTNLSGQITFKQPLNGQITSMTSVGSLTLDSFLLDKMKDGELYGSGEFCFENNQVVVHDASETSSSTLDTSTEGRFHRTTYPGEVAGKFLFSKALDEITAQSNWLTLNAAGSLDLLHLMPHLEQIIIKNAHTQPMPRTVAATTQTKMYAIVRPKLFLPKALFPEFGFPELISMTGSIDALANQMNFDLKTDTFSVKDIVGVGITAHMAQDDDDIALRLSLPNIGSDKLLGKMNVELNAKTVQDSILLALGIADSLQRNHTLLSSYLYNTQAGYAFSLLPEQILASKRWAADPKNVLYWYDTARDLVANHCNLSHGQQSVSLAGNFKEKFYVNLDQFDLTNLPVLFAQQQNINKGIATGQLSLLQGSSQLDGKMTVDSLEFANIPLGKLRVTLANNTSSVNPTDHKAVFDAHLLQQSGYLQASGTLGTNDSVDATLVLSHFDMNSLQPFTQDNFSTLQGKANGRIDLNGSLTKLSWEGKIDFDNLCITPVANNVHYCLKRNALVFQNDSIKLRDWVINDVYDHALTLSGHLKWDNFEHLKIDLVFGGNNVLVLHHDENSSSEYTGKIFADIEGTVGGSSVLPEINLKVSPSSESELNYYHSNVSTAESDLVVFDAPAVSTAEKTAVPPQKYNLNLVYEDNANLALHMKLSPLKSDYFAGKGIAKLLLTRTAERAMTIIGSYSITEGEYAYSPTKFISRKFRVENGSTITWYGNPLEPELKLNAQYFIKALPPFSSTSSGRTQEKPTFLVNIHITEYPNKPDIRFSIAYPTSDNAADGTTFGNTPDSEIEAALLGINKDPGAATNHAISLLSLGRFYGNNDFNNVLGDILNVNGFIARQLNNLVKDNSFFEVKFAPINTIYGSRLGVTISKKLLNNRLVFRVEGSPIAQQSETILRNFNAEYLLHPSGKWKIRGFTGAEDSEFFQDFQNPKSGAGLIFSLQF